MGEKTRSKWRRNTDCPLSRGQTEGAARKKVSMLRLVPPPKKRNRCDGIEKEEEPKQIQRGGGPL